MSETETEGLFMSCERHLTLSTQQKEICEYLLDRSAKGRIDIRV